MSAPASTAPQARGLRQAVSALHHRNFARFWTGALISNVGTWMQNVTVPYVIYERTRSASLVGIAGFAQFIPGLLLGPVGGSLADRYPRRTVLLVTQSMLGVLGFALWGVYVAGVANTPVLIGIVFLGGVVTGINVPSWQAFVSELVPRESLLNAVTLNSAQFNAARAIGPAVAGAVLAFGPSWAFLVNGMSKVAVLAALVSVQLAAKPAGPVKERQIVKDFAESLRYTRDHEEMLLAVSLVFAIAFLGNPLFQLIPIFAKEVFDVGAQAYGALTGALGVGGVVGAVLLGSLGNIDRRGRLVRFALVFYACALAAFGAAPTYTLGLVLLLPTGMLFIMVVASLNVSVQLSVPEHMRGRAMALYVMTFTGAYPIGSLVQGALSDAIGVQRTVVGAAAVLLVIGIAAGSRRGLFEHLDRNAPDVMAVEDEPGLPADAVPPPDVVPVDHRPPVVAGRAVGDAVAFDKAGG